MSALVNVTPADVAAQAAKRQAVKMAAAARANAAAKELKKLLGTRKQFGRLMPPEQRRLEAACRTLRQDGWAIGR